MEQFSPDKSKIFAAAAFANLYSSPVVIGVRALVGIILGYLLFTSSTQESINLFYLISSLLIVFFVFEVFYRAKILNERPIPLNRSKGGNLADSFSFDTARFLVKNRGNSSLDAVLASLLKDPEASFAFFRADVSQESLGKILSSSAQEEPVNWNGLITTAKKWAEKEGQDSIDKLDILLAIFAQSKGLQKLMFEKEIKERDLVHIVFWARNVFERDLLHFWQKPVESLGPGMAEFWLGGWTLETEKFTADLTKHLLKSRSSTTLVGRDHEIEQVEEVLARSEKRNVILLGTPGIGKTTIVYSLAEKSIQGVLPPALKYKRFLELDVTSLLAGAAQGQLEERIQNLFTEVGHAGNVVLFVPELENLAGSSGTGINITGHLLGALNSGRIQVIATSTRESHRRYIERQAAFSSLFEVVDIAEPSEDSAIRIVEEAAPTIESKNKVIITYKAIQKTVELADKYMVDRVLPGKAIDLISEAATAISIKKKGLLEPTDVEDVISQKTKIPIKAATGQEAKQLLNLEKILHERIVDQNEAITAVSNALRRARTIERTTKRPIGTFLFLGPTGVGKTETAKTLAKLYFQSEESIIRVDMSEFQSPDSLNRLIGAPPGSANYEQGGGLTEKVRQRPYSLILLDEMEKAHQKIQEAFLPVFDEGVLEDASGRKIVFTNSLIIATSNAGAEFIRESIQEGTNVEGFKSKLLEKLQREQTFKPEFLNRFDDIVVYKPLSEAEVVQVVKLMINNLKRRLKKQDIDITIDEEALVWIAKSGFDPQYGARPLNRFIANNLEEKIAEKILSGEVKRGTQVKVSVTNNTISLH
jgi:ATP-dependent Clp protease ATP-binding subunit ClpC